MGCCTNQVSKYVYLYRYLCFYNYYYFCRLFSKKERRCHDAINNVYDRRNSHRNQSDHDFCNSHTDDKWWLKPDREKKVKIGKKSQLQKDPWARRVDMSPYL